MSVFSMIKRGRQAAKEHNAKQAEEKKAETEKIPYRHVPSHAAIDALSGGPASWREVDRPRILEQNRRRSVMTANGVGMGGMMTPVHSGMPRVNSALSHVSYPSAYASPVVHMPRAYSYSSMSPGWANQGGEIVYTPIEPTNVSIKGKEVDRTMIDSGRASRSSSKGSGSPVEGPSSSKDVAVSPVGSSSNSTSSQDDLEMKPAKHAAVATSAVSSAATTPRERPVTEFDYFHRLHPSHSRRVSDPSQQAMQPRTTPMPARPSPSRGYSNSMMSGGVPPVPALPPMQFGSSFSTPLSASSAGSAASSVTAVAPGASTVSLSKIGGPIPHSVAEEEVDTANSYTFEPSMPVGTAISTPTLAHKNRRISKTTRFTELETINSNMTASIETGMTSVQQTRSSVAAMSLPTVFDDSKLPAPFVQPPQKTGKLTKNSGAKLSKKNRWSLRGSKSAAVAG